MSRIVTGEADVDFVHDGKNRAAVELGRRRGKFRAEKFTSEQRSDIA